MRKKNKHVTFSLDLGTTKFCLAALVAEGKKTSPELRTMSMPAQGMRRGMLSDISLAKNALNNLLKQAEKKWNLDIKKAAVGIAGSHLYSYQATRDVAVNGEEISLNILRNMKEDIANNPMNGRENLHVFPINFRINNRNRIENPLGMAANHLRGSYLVIDADRNYLQDVIQTCNQAGLEVSSLFSEPLASSSVTISEEEKELGIAIADIGGGTTDGIIFIEGKPVSLFTVDIGGLMMTKDLSIGLNLSVNEAEKAKRFFGFSINCHQTLAAIDLQGKAKQINNAMVHSILKPRVEELINLLHKKLHPFWDGLNNGIILTGGGADVKGIESFFSSKFSKHVRSAQPWIGFFDEKQHFASPFATSLGLLNLEYGKNQSKLKQYGSGQNRYFSQFFSWLKELNE